MKPTIPGLVSIVTLFCHDPPDPTYERVETNGSIEFSRDNRPGGAAIEIEAAGHHLVISYQVADLAEALANADEGQHLLLSIAVDFAGIEGRGPGRLTVESIAGGVRFTAATAGEVWTFYVLPRDMRPALVKLRSTNN